MLGSFIISCLRGIRFSLCSETIQSYPDHLGSSTFLTDFSGQAYEFMLYLPFGEQMASQKMAGYSTPYRFTSKELDVETGLYYFGARYYDAQVGLFHGVDPLASKMPGWSPYNYALNNPILNIDIAGLFPWPVTVRSFISANRVGGGMFRGDGRGASFSGTSRVSSSFTVDPSAKSLTNRTLNSDPTVFYGAQLRPGMSIPPQVKNTEPEMSAEIKGKWDNSVAVDFSHNAKDPITPGIVTPDLDLNAGLIFSEDLENGTLSILGSFTGDNFPSAEAFITDQGGTNLFLGASKETGGVHSLFGENNNRKFNVDMQILFNSDGNFTGVRQGDKTYSIQEWNQHVQDSFDK